MPQPQVEFVASDVYVYYRPSECELRVWLRRHGFPDETEPSPFELVLRRLGDRHEREHLSLLQQLADVVDLSSVAREERVSRTIEAVRAGAPAIYQGALSATLVLDEVECRISGSPDFLVRDGAGYRIRDSKLARRIGLRGTFEPGPGPDAPDAAPGEEPANDVDTNGDGFSELVSSEDEPVATAPAQTAAAARTRRGRAKKPEHPEILLQLGIYGWLYEQTLGEPALRLEVHAGNGSIVEVPYEGGRGAIDLLTRMLRLQRAEAEPYSPVGWSKCAGCGYRPRCWPRAEAARDLALIPAIRQNRALALRAAGFPSIDALLATFDESSLAAFTWTEGTKTRRFGDGGPAVLRSARALATGEEILLQPPRVPPTPAYAVFDVEGMPPYLDELEKVYLWGLQVFGHRIGSGTTRGYTTGPFLPAVAGFGAGGDAEGWRAFLTNARAIFDQHGDVPFVHWGAYERTKLTLYTSRFGDPEGVAARVRNNLLDLCRVTKDSVVLPLSSYSLKAVESHVGFERKLPYRGDQAMASYIEAVETNSEERRNELMAEILAYNREDLEATWAVLRWLRGKSSETKQTTNIRQSC